MIVHFTEDDTEQAIREYVENHFPQHRVESVIDGYKTYNVTIVPKDAPPASVTESEDELSAAEVVPA